MLRTLAPALLPFLALSLAAETPQKTTKGKAKPAKAAEAPKPQAAKPEVAHPASQGLKVGDPAPAFKASRWVKGGPVTLEKGKVYVVEFWATWCGPCRETIPHLTEMAKAREGKATFLGVDVWERGAGAEVDKKVDEFVKNMGDKMGYAVCRDTEDQHMANAWMKAADQNGIPAAFIVDSKGLVAYIGHPMGDDFSKTLDAVIEGKHDLKAAQAKAAQEAAEKKAQQEKAAALQAAWKEAAPAIEEAVKAKDWAKVLTLAEAAEAKNADLKPRLKRPRFLALAATDAAKAQALIDADLAKPTVDSCMTTAIMLMDKNLDKRWTEQAIGLIDRAVGLEPRLEPRVAPIRFDALMRVDLAKAKAQFEAEKAKGKAGELAAAVVQSEAADKAWLEDAVALLEASMKAPEPNNMLLQALAEGQFKVGRAKDAARSLEIFIEWARKQGAPPAFLKGAEDKLKTYQAAQ